MDFDSVKKKVSTLKLTNVGKFTHGKFVIERRKIY